MQTERYTQSEHMKGIICIILAAFFFSLMSVFVKLSGDVPTMQKSLFRNLIAAVIAFVTLAGTPEKFSIRRDCIGGLLLRSLFGTIGILCNFWAIDHMIISDANMLNRVPGKTGMAAGRRRFRRSLICDQAHGRRRQFPGSGRGSGRLRGRDRLHFCQENQHAGRTRSGDRHVLLRFFLFKRAALCSGGFPSHDPFPDPDAAGRRRLGRRRPDVRNSPSSAMSLL